MEKEKLPNPLMPKEGKSGRDVIDIEGQEFYGQLAEDIEDLKKADSFFQILLRKKIINLDEIVSSVREQINKRMGELEETRSALGSKGFVRDPKIKFHEIDEEFQQLMVEDRDKIETELEYLGTAYRVLGHLLRAGIISESDTFIKAVEAVFSQIKKFTP